MTLNLGAGDGLVIYTDGVCDAIDGQGRAFGSDRLEPCLQALSQAPAREIVDELFEQVDRFAAAVAQEDDITVVALRYRGHAIDG
jgi:sigma-B regulation protein RsbU (phosphoserine phosphatase)